MNRITFDLCFPVRGVSGPTQLEAAIAADRLGWRGVWCSELLGLDALVMLGAIAARTQSSRIGTAAVPATTRSAALLAMAASTLAQLAPERVVLGIGASTPAVVRDRHDRPVQNSVREIVGVIDVVQAAVRGRRVSHGAFPRVSDLQIDPAETPPLLFLAALGKHLTGIAHSHCDGLLLNMVPFPNATARAASARMEAPGKFETALLVRTCVDPSDAELARLRNEVASYLRIPAYASALTDSDIDASGVVTAPNLKVAADRISDDMLNVFVVTGDAETCVARLAGLQAQGVTALVVPPPDHDLLRDLVEALAPDT
jgi:alkanesulfonate monooxygenase SsuD/methylene tetrahydromethanopterin reductase-like flavin-dependent oxidoreductase (luciferase family)